MLDRTDFASWQQRIRLYCGGKDNGATNILLQGLPKDIYTLINHYTDAKDIWDNVKMLLEGSELTKEDMESKLYDEFEHFRQHKEESINDYYVRVGNVNQGQARPGKARTVKCYNYNGGPDNAFDDDVDEQPVQDLALNMDNVFRAEDCDAFDSDIDEAPTAQTMCMANLSSADPITDEYVKDNDVSVVHSTASPVPNDTFMMIYDDMCEPISPYESHSSRNAAVKNSLTAELATYREQVELETLAESTEGTPQFGPERPRVYSNLNSIERDRYNADIRATNILLPGLPKNIYTLINHYTDAKDIWDNVKMLLEGSELTKEDKESQLFVMAVKLNRGLRESNYDQLFAYLKQHEAYAKENKMVLERLAQPIAQPTAYPLALLSNVSNAQHGLPSSSTSSITPLTLPRANSTDDLIENLTSMLALLTQSYRTFFPQTNNQLRTSSNPRNQATVQDGRVEVQNVQGQPNRGQGMKP
nr:hypothetical protein [Tanacetum cinerariifolium]